MMACMLVVAGIQLVAFACFTKIFAVGEGLLPENPKFTRMFRVFTLEKGAIAGVAFFLLGIAILVRALWIWKTADYGLIPFSDNLRRLIPAATFIVVGVQIISSSFFMSILGLKTATRKPPATGAADGH